MFKRIILTHIPRTGGTSLSAALRAQQPDAKFGEFKSFSEPALMKDSELNSYQLISTYIGSKLFDRLDESWAKVLILRDPVPRLRSSYWNLRKTPGNISFASPVAKSCGFRDYLASRDPSVIFQATNVQMWTVLGDRSIYFREKHAGVTDERLIEAAIQRLNIYDFVGFTDVLVELWALLCQHFGWKVTELPKLGANPPLEMAEDATIDDWDYHTRLDREFVRLARAMVSISRPLR